MGEARYTDGEKARGEMDKVEREREREREREFEFRNKI